MADETTAPEQSETDQQATEQQAQQPDIPAEVKAALKKANKEAETLRLKLKEYEDAQKSEQQKTEERLLAAEKTAAESQAALLRYQVGLAKGLPPELIDRLRGFTTEELEADAEQLLSLVPRPPAARGAVDQGARTDATPGSKKPDINELLHQAVRG